MTDSELRQLIESNARAIQALLDARAEERMEFQAFQERITRLDDVVERLTNLQVGISRMLASLDEDRPTVLRKLNAIEGKVDRLLEQSDRADNL
ncbi:MAG: hypothetical protein KME45_31435 [Stenomitos rutilans HA7619-LM2]|jgi:chromosome segregation ATPase|nr:hypothetical protein [Stenomitos rutilans HA7619-LM2]